MAMENNDLKEADPINSLSREIVELIFEYVHDTSPPTLTSLTLVSRVFYACAYPLKHRTYIFTLMKDMKDEQSRRSVKILRGLLEDPAKKHILHSIHTISFTSFQRPGKLMFSNLMDRSQVSHGRVWLMMVKLMSKIPYLKSLTLRGTDPLLDTLVYTLEKYHPHAQLHIQNWTRIKRDEDHNNAAEIALARSPNLHSLQARLLRPNLPIDLQQVALKRIIAMSPNLSELEIVQEPFESRGSNPTIEEQHEQTRMQEEFWKPMTCSFKMILSLRLCGGLNMSFLEDVLDLSMLRTLDVGRLSMSRGIVSPISISQGHASKFPNLRSLSFAMGDSNSAYVYDLMIIFLQTCTCLESLSITDGANHVPITTICSYGATLRRLVLHEVESATSHVDRSIPIPQLKLLTERCRLLEDITIDAGQTKSVKDLNETLSILAILPSLHTIRIYVPLGVVEEADRTPHIFLDDWEMRAEIEAHRTKPFSPIEDACWLEKGWSLLRQEKKKNGTKPIRELHVKVGEWEREMSGGFPSGWVVWEAINRRYYIATPHERDDRPNDINVHIRGTEPYSNVDIYQIRRVPHHVDL